MSTTKTPSAARQRILETGERLFYAEGIRSVGIDRIIAEAGVAKMTLYNHFASKDELIAAVLKHRDETIFAFFRAAVARYVEAGADPLDAFFAALKEWFESRGFRGCAFINAAIELVDPSHAGYAVVVEHKRVFREMLTEIIVESAGSKAAGAAPAIYVLVEGAIVTALIQRTSTPADTAKEAARTLVSSAKRARKR